MPLPPPDPETLWKELVHDLPPETAQMAWACTAFARARTIKTPAHLGRVVVLDGGLDNPGRAVAGKVPARPGPITEHAVAERWRACGPWVNAVLRPQLPRPWVATRPHALRVVVIDARSRQAPGAPGTDERLPIRRDVRSWEVLAGSIPEVPPGETLTHGALGPGEVAITARGAAPPRGMGDALDRGAALLVRLHPFRMVLGDTAGHPWPLGDAVKRQRADPLRPLPVVIRSASDDGERRGCVQAERWGPEHAHRARQPCRQRQKQGAPHAETLWLAGWVLVGTPWSPAGRSAHTIVAVYRCRWPVARARKRWQRGLDVDARRAKAQRPLAAVERHGQLRDALRRERRPRRDPWSRLDHQRLATGWRLWGMRTDASAPMRTGALFWKEAAWEACLQVVAARPRRRT